MEQWTPDAEHGNSLAAPRGTRPSNCGRLKASPTPYWQPLPTDHRRRARDVGALRRASPPVGHKKGPRRTAALEFAKGRTNVGARFQVGMGRGAGVTTQAPPQAALQDELYE